MMKIKGFITHKKAEKYEDCQDYFAINKDKGCLAISDGMSQSIFPQWWAEELVRAYVYNDWMPDQNDLVKLRGNWLKQVHEFLESQKQSGKPTWMLENCLIEKRGAGATFCGIRFEDETKWKGHILGDSCLIEVLSDSKIKRLERSNEGAFDNNPDYFDSFAGGRGNVKSIDGSLEEGAKLLLVTDALAEFLYAKKESAAEYVHQLLDIKCHEDFCALIDGWRESEHLHNDDTTLLVVEYDGAASLNVICEDSLPGLIRSEQEESLDKIEDENAAVESDKCCGENDLCGLLDELKRIVQQLPKTHKKLKKRLLDKISRLGEFINKHIKDGKTPEM